MAGPNPLVHAARPVPTYARAMLSFRDAAAYLTCSPRHLDRLLQRGEVPVIHFGNVRRFLVADLDAYIDSLRSPRPE